MTGWQIVAVLITLTAVLSYLNERTLKLPTTIGVMLISLILSLGLIGLGSLGFGFEGTARGILEGIAFDKALMQGMLSFLLFAGALHVDINELARHKGVIGILASAGVLFSTLLIGTGMHLVLGALGLGIPYVFSLLFGALISPTDPIAVLGILKKAKVPKSLEIKVIGESLFNDGVG